MPDGGNEVKTVLVTGGAGFVGRHLVRRLYAMPEVEHVTVIDNFSSGHIESLPKGDTRLEIIAWDISEAIPALTLPYDTVFHLASNPDISKAATEPEIDFTQGTLLTQNVLEFCRKNRVERLIYFSGSGVYGEDAGSYFGEERSVCTPISTYGASKLAGEAMISAYCHMFGLSALVFRPANIVGPGQTHGVGFDFMRKLKENPRELEILGDGKQAKAYVHIDDMIDAVLLANGRHVKGFDVYNVSNKFLLSVKEIAHLAVEVSGMHPSWTDFKFSGGSRGWKGDVPVVKMDSTKILALGWRPKYSSSDAMKSALEAMI